MGYSVGVDTGGTFVDVVLSDDDGLMTLSKTPSDPADLPGAVLRGLETTAQGRGVTLDELLRRTDRIIHGSTVATNALLTGKGASAALVTTRGFRDVLHMRRGVRPVQLDSRHAPAAPLIARELTFEVDERIDCDGRVVTPLNPAELDGLVDAIARTGVRGVAICFMFSYLHPDHEEQVRERIERSLPDVHVSISSEVFPQTGFYERTSTTAVNAVVSPLLASYLDDLEQRLLDRGFGGTLLMMQSNGGVCSPDFGKKFGVGAVLSGPAAAPVAAASVSSLHGIGNVIVVDMGGTSFDVCLINSGEPQVTTEGELGGIRVAIPMVDLHTIGAGGGSVVGVDSRQLMSVGPQSAGAFPGPVSYGRGGTEPTVTDANVLLGYIDPHTFWGGQLELDVAAARTAFQERAGDPLGLDALDAAFGAYRIVNESMVDAIREVSVRRGHDPRRYALVAAGGAGPLHVGALAAELKVPLVIVPRMASAFCALGGLLSDLRHEFVAGLTGALEDLDLAITTRTLQRLAEQGRATLRAEGVADQDQVIRRFISLRYAGQFSDVQVELSSGELSSSVLGEVVTTFHKRHEQINGWQDVNHSIEIVNVSVLAVGVTEKRPMPTIDGQSPQERPRRRQIYWDGAHVDVAVHDSAALAPGSVIPGLAIVEQPTTTLIVPPDYVLETDEYGNGLMYAADRTLADVFSVLKGSN
ncbi:MAG: N-methylhydantoinase A/acetone carboxylase, beta subunit [Blastococcus sp.]|jgi:N-methylhydantoinase A|nr:N-methylhydantoinase A/acetone carboxylase, beta subunit [Blastococcus sp.]